MPQSCLNRVSLRLLRVSLVAESCRFASYSCLNRVSIMSHCVSFAKCMTCLDEPACRNGSTYMECGACGRYAKCKWCQCRNRAYCSESCKNKRWEEWGSCCSNRQKGTAMMCCRVCMEYAKCRTCLCGADWYCNRDCQKQHWEEHKQYCSVKLVRRAGFAARNCGKDT